MRGSFRNLNFETVRYKKRVYYIGKSSTILEKALPPTATVATNLESLPALPPCHQLPNRDFAILARTRGKSGLVSLILVSQFEKAFQGVNKSMRRAFLGF
jgi:hypothetical protein